MQNLNTCTSCNQRLTFGRSAAQECPNSHGHYQGYSLLLAERGLVRPIYPHDRQALRAQGRSLSCLNCGAPMNNAAQDCSYCYSPPVMVDVPRLTAALLLRFGDAVPIDTPVQLWAFDCLGCGQALDPTVDIRCPQRDQSVALPQLHLLTPLLNHVEPVLLGRMPYRQWWRGDLQLAATYLRNLSTENARHLQEGFA